MRGRETFSTLAAGLRRQLVSAPGPTSPEWVNTPVLAEAIRRYEEGLLPRPMVLWVQDLLELDPMAPPVAVEVAPGA